MFAFPLFLSLFSLCSITLSIHSIVIANPSSPLDYSLVYPSIHTLPWLRRVSMGVVRMKNPSRIRDLSSLTGKRVRRMKRRILHPDFPTSYPFPSCRITQRLHSFHSSAAIHLLFCLLPPLFFPLRPLGNGLSSFHPHSTTLSISLVLAPGRGEGTITMIVIQDAKRLRGIIHSSHWTLSLPLFPLFLFLPSGHYSLFPFSLSLWLKARVSSVVYTKRLLVLLLPPSLFHSSSLSSFWPFSVSLTMQSKWISLSSLSLSHFSLVFDTNFLTSFFYRFSFLPTNR